VLSRATPHRQCLEARRGWETQAFAEAFVLTGSQARQDASIDVETTDPHPL
jgi:hypothetical protein